MHFFAIFTIIEVSESTFVNARKAVDDNNMTLIANNMCDVRIYEASECVYQSDSQHLGYIYFTFPAVKYNFK